MRSANVNRVDGSAQDAIIAVAAARRRAGRVASTRRQVNRLRAILSDAAPLPDMTDPRTMLDFLFGSDPAAA